MQRILLMLLAVLLVVATGASAQTTTRIEGTVASIDPVGKTITFTDGRVMRFDSDARIFVNGREVLVNEVRPGAVVVVTSAVPAAPTARGTERITGTVAAIDPVAKTITFADGRMVQFDQNTRLIVNGREVGVNELRPGVVIATAPAASSTVVVPGPAQVAAAPGTVMARPHHPIEARGVIASVDNQNGIVILQDGRMLRISDRGRVWQPANIGTLQPGTEVFISDAVPMGYRSAGAAHTWGERDVMGRVIRVNEGANEIMLSDGTVIRVSPSTKMVLGNGQVVTLRELRPGDQLIVRVREVPAGTAAVVPGTPARVAGDQTTYASYPAFRGAVIEADHIVVIRLAQAP